jgi:hypothetical protein
MFRIAASGKSAALNSQTSLPSRSYSVIWLSDEMTVFPDARRTAAKARALAFRSHATVPSGRYSRTRFAPEWQTR